MSDPSQTKETLHQAIHRLGSCPPPETIPSEDNLPELDFPDDKPPGYFFILIILVLAIFLGAVSLAIAWRAGLV